MRIRPIPSIVGLTVAIAAGQAGAAQPSFVARVDRSQVGVGESFTLEITLSVEGGRVDGYRPPELRGLRSLSERPSQSTQMQMGGGGTFVRQVYGWRYEVLTLDRGTFNVGPARVRVDGQELRTEKIAITVVDSAKPRPPGVLALLFHVEFQSWPALPRPRRAGRYPAC